MNILSGLSAFFKSTLITKASSLITQLVLGFYLSQEDFLFGSIQIFSILLFAQFHRWVNFQEEIVNAMILQMFDLICQTIK